MTSGLTAMVLFCVGISGVAHGGFAVGLGWWAKKHPAPSALFRGDDGENGRTGAGGTTTDFELEGERTEHIGVQRGGEPTPPPVIEPTPPPVVVPVVPVRPRHTVTRPQPAATEPTTAAVPQPATPVTPPPVVAGAATGTEHSGGTGAAETQRGQRSGSIGEQRALLPRAARCGDEVAGTWRAHRYNAAQHDWVIFTLRIQRGSGDALRGTIHSRLWSGLSMDSRPPGRCSGGLMDYDYLVRMPAEGFYRPGRQVLFGADTWQRERTFCASAYNHDYNPDSFSGTIDVDRQEFQSVNNDGGQEQNVPYVFRRIGCNPGDEAPAAGATPTVPTPTPTTAAP